MSVDAKTVFASFSPLPGKEDDLEALLRTMIAPTRGEPGCQQYDLYRSDGEGGVSYHLIERYDDAAAVDAHRATSHYEDYRSKVTDLIEGGVGVVVLSPVEVA